MPLRTKEEQEAFIEERKTGIGGSDAPAILGVSPWKSPQDVYAEKLGLLPGKQVNEYMKWGHLLEEPIAQNYANETGFEVIDLKDEMHRHPKFDFMFSHTDRLAIDPEHGPGVLEIKQSTRRQDYPGGEAPIWNKIQTLHNMMVLKKKHDIRWGEVVCLIPGTWEFHITRIHFHARLEGIIVKKERKLWECVQREEVPPVIGPVDDAVLFALYPEADAEKKIVLPPEAIDLDQELIQVEAKLDELTRRRADIRTRIKTFMEDAKYGVLPNNEARYVMPTVHVKERTYTKKAYSFRSLRRFEIKEK